MSKERSSPPLWVTAVQLSVTSRSDTQRFLHQVLLFWETSSSVSTVIREDAEQLPLNVHMELVGLKDSIPVALGGQAKEFSEGLKGIFIHLVSFWRTTAGFMVNLPLQDPHKQWQWWGHVAPVLWEQPHGEQSCIAPSAVWADCKGRHYHNIFRAPQAVWFSCSEEVKEWYYALLSRL